MEDGGVTMKNKEDGLFPFRTKSHQRFKNYLQVLEVTDAMLFSYELEYPVGSYLQFTYP